MSKVIIDLNEFVHIKDESEYNHNYYMHKEYRYKILEICDEEYNSLNFYKLSSDGIGKVFLFSCQDDYDESKVYEGDLGFFWS